MVLKVKCRTSPYCRNVETMGRRYRTASELTLPSFDCAQYDNAGSGVSFTLHPRKDVGFQS